MISMMVNGKKVRCRDLERLIMRVVSDILVHFQVIKGMVRGQCGGHRGKLLLVFGKTES